MATTLTVNTLRASVGWQYTNSTSFGSNSTNSSSFNYSKTLANGTGASAAQKLYVAAVTISGSSTSSLDLSGSLEDLFGNAMVMTKLKVLYIEHATAAASSVLHVYGNFTQATSGNAQPLLLGGTTPTAKLVLRPGGCLLLSCTDATGYTVTDSSGDTITLDNQASGAVTINVALIGE